MSECRGQVRSLSLNSTEGMLTQLTNDSGCGAALPHLYVSVLHRFKWLKGGSCAEALQSLRDVEDVQASGA